MEGLGPDGLMGPAFPAEPVADEVPAGPPSPDPDPDPDPPLNPSPHSVPHPGQDCSKGAYHLYVDFNKAFNSVPRRALFRALRRYGFPESLV